MALWLRGAERDKLCGMHECREDQFCGCRRLEYEGAKL